jgi:hypothetical protein
MKYTKQNIQKKRQILSSEKVRRNSKISLFLFKYAFIISIALIVTGLGLGVGFVRGILKTTPQITKDSVHSKGYITTIYDNKGSTIKTLSNHDSNRIYTPLSSIPKNLQHAFIAIEDERYYSHNGIDLYGIIRASELNEFIGEHFKGQFCLSGACYPETHQEADGFKKDLEALKKKVDAGAEYLVTQIFFDNDYYYRLVREARKIGITVPILAGIMPITNAKSLIRTTKMCGCTIPYQLSTMIEAHYDNPEAMKEIGINYAAQQIIDLITNGVDGIHIYTMNRAETAQRVFESIPAVLKELN